MGEVTLEMKTLPELEWNFDNVPDNELAAYYYWEYSRESTRIRAVFEQDDKVFLPNQLVVPIRIYPDIIGFPRL